MNPTVGLVDLWWRERLDLEGIIRALLRIGTVVAVLAVTSLAGLGQLEAISHPETLTDRRPVSAGPVEPGFPIEYVGVVWDEGHPHEEHSEGADGYVRFRHDGVWGQWIRLIEDGADKDGIWASGLVSAGGADAYQIRGLPPEVHDARAVALNTTDGPLRVTGYRPAGAAAAIDNCLSRAEWGAEEDLRLDSGGNEAWPPDFYAPQVMTVHHTATQNDDPDPAATVRAIYEYHAVDQGWGDIGYHMLIDEQGRVYEGRWSGTTSTPCSGGGDGSDFAHGSTTDTEDLLVTAGHTAGHNSGNFGVALLGEFTTHPRSGGEPKQAAVDALVGVLAEFASRHGLDPHAKVDYVNPVNGYERTVDMISGHRDWKSTECPGELLYDDLSEIRDAVTAAMGTVDVVLTAPVDGEVVFGTVTVEAASESATQVDFLVDGSTIGTDTADGDGWSTSWDTSTYGDGGRTLSATATDSGANTASYSVTVTVDNVDDAPTVVIIEPAAGATVSGTVTVVADADDDRGVSQVEFFVDGESIGVDSDSSDGWSASWDTSTYGDGGHTLSATATDSGGNTASYSIAVTVDNGSGGITLSATGYKVRGLQKADLEWSGATSTNVDVYRDGSSIATTANDGAYTDNIDQRGGDSYTYQLCEAGTSTCSAEATVDF